MDESPANFSYRSLELLCRQQAKLSATPDLRNASNWPICWNSNCQGRDNSRFDAAEISFGACANDHARRTILLEWA